MISPDEALARLLAMAQPVETERQALHHAVGRWVGAAVTARRTQPARDLSAMDGYAIRAADLPGPWTVIGESAAGVPFDRSVGAREAVRIFTGAPVPAGADTVLIQENASLANDQLVLTSGNNPVCGAHIRPRGSDFSDGQALLQAGQQLTAARVGLVAMGGHNSVIVHRRVRVAIISTGSELVPVGAAPGTDHIPASNAVMLAAMLDASPVDITDCGIVPDDQAMLADAFAAAAAFDVILVTGGASVGKYDLVQPALVDAGASIDFWKVAMRPGKPVLAGRLGQAIVLGLPGNPVSAFVTATLFLKPLLQRLAGAIDITNEGLTATLDQALPAVADRTDYIRALLTDDHVRPLVGDSGMLLPLAAANALIVRPAHAPPAAIGVRVAVIRLA